MEDNNSGTFTSSPEKIEYGRLVSCVQNLESYVITKQPFKVGRSKHCDVVLENIHLQNFVGNVSKEHFIITKDSKCNMMYLTDVSKNGTYINGKKVGRNQKALLKDDSKISVGHIKCFVFIFRCVLAEELPDTLTPLSLTYSGDTSDTILPSWGRLVSCMLCLESLDLIKPLVKIGRSTVCDVIIDHTQMRNSLKQIFSKEHFSIFKDSDYLVTYITDHSKSGTYLNGSLVGKSNRHILQDEDIISVGSPKLKLYLYKCMYNHYPNDLPPSLKKKYQLTKLLGKGAVGEVILAFEKNSCKMFAIKKIMKGRSTTSQIHKMNHPNKIRSEIYILKQLSHPFVINLKDIEETAEEVFIVLEYMEGGELTNRILSTNPLTESNIKFLFYQILLAVEFLHSKGVTHRDLKPENVLLASEDVETLVKVSDFGLSKVTDEDCAMKTVCGTLHYIAPEVIDSTEYNKQVDIWSLGVILFYMLSKQLPFRSTDKQSMANLIRTGKYKMDESWNSVSENAKDLVRKMLIVDPAERITISEMKKHPWLDKNVKNRVHALLESNMILTEENPLGFDKEPSPKRRRLSQSDE